MSDPLMIYSPLLNLKPFVTWRHGAIGARGSKWSKHPGVQEVMLSDIPQTIRTHIQQSTVLMFRRMRLEVIPNNWSKW